MTAEFCLPENLHGVVSQHNYIFRVLPRWSSVLLSKPLSLDSWYLITRPYTTTVHYVSWYYDIKRLIVSVLLFFVTFFLSGHAFTFPETVFLFTNENKRVPWGRRTRAVFFLIRKLQCNYLRLRWEKRIAVTAQSKAWFCGRPLAGIMDSNPAKWMYVYCECCVFLGRSLCDGLVSRPEESYHVVCVCVCVCVCVSLIVIRCNNNSLHLQKAKTQEERKNSENFFEIHFYAFLWMKQLFFMYVNLLKTKRNLLY